MPLDKKFELQSKCNRCQAPTTITTMSIFNVEMICMDCEEKEKAHPDYEKAKEMEMQEVRNGNYNFPGVGKPDDL